VREVSVCAVFLCEFSTTG